MDANMSVLMATKRSPGAKGCMAWRREAQSPGGGAIIEWPLLSPRGGTNAGAGCEESNFLGFPKKHNRVRSASAETHPPFSNDGQQLPRAADGHEPGVMFVVGGDVAVGRHTDEDDGLRVETLGLVDGGVADAVGAVLFLGAFAEVAE